ncbi:unnamed protein product [Mytilus coruscus]|uniref:Uncharacterized protein n=1 Tax=Mytilus coruscus TaxID=42192 RepID=A0A6J8CUN0_MYTCO|nr:unnamed protein product [Mytilus coruscus]
MEKDIKSLKQDTSEIHLFQAVRLLDANTHRKELEIRDIQTANIPTLTYFPPDLESIIEKVLQDLGTIHIENAQVPMSVLEIDQQVLFPVKPQGDQKKLSLTNSFQTRILGDNVCIYKGCFIPGNSDKVFVVTSDGKEREIYTSPDLEDSQGVAVDHRGDVYVVGRGSNNIHRISEDGQEHDIVLTADDGINLPGGLSYNFETRELLVINNNYETVNIYKTPIMVQCPTVSNKNP